ncbi:dihydrofolate synthetase Fol3 [Purpureocillium lilacinum]|uniref:Dihydrofolate synthetase Fol3 n=1 Tax=Purpureocillium lilacinum TaxID=33203 RepID=A0A179H2C6_PURLI|nr:dihydrofolate synthetase Fol3 [Purpureocillium lilacinum]
MPSAKEVKRALARIRAALPREKKVASDHRNIRLGLERISRVVPDEQSWAGVHVGGTNGKGSICALLAGMFKLSGISHGTFISPAIPERHNAITINDRYVNKRMYDMELQHVEAAYRRVASGWRFTSGEDPGDLTPFELETAAAFRVFDKMHVKYGIVEVGMGGATDATNAMKQKSVTVISKIDLDHQEYLGNTIEEIAKVKAGIMRPGVPCIVDHTNPSSVLGVLREHAQSVGTQISPSSKALPLIAGLDQDRFKLEDYEQQNLLCATLAFRHLFPHLDIDVNKLLSMKPYLPGRKEYVGVSGLTDGLRQKPVLVDGAHNMLGVEALAKHVETRVRKDDQPITWVMGLSASKSKPFSKMIEALLRPQDNLAFVEYTQGPNDPPAAPADLGRGVAKEALKNESQLYDGEPDIASAVRWACSKAGEGPVIITGSLYLIREFYKLEGVEQQRKIGTRRPGRAQLWHYTQLSQQRALTAEEAQEYKKARRHWRLSPLRNPTFKTSQEGGQPQPPTVSEQTRELQRTAAHHKKQADGYRSAIASIQNDLDAERTGGPGSSHLSGSIDELKRRHEEHIKAYNSAMFKIRGHVADPDKKHLSHEEIFGRPEKPKRRIATLLRKFEEDEAREQESKAATASSRRAIENEILQASRDVLGEGFGGQRRKQRSNEPAEGSKPDKGTFPSEKTVGGRR